MCQNRYSREPYQLKLSKNQKERIKENHIFFRNSDSVDEIDVLSELLGVL